MMLHDIVYTRDLVGTGTGLQNDRYKNEAKNVATAHEGEADCVGF